MEGGGAPKHAQHSIPSKFCRGFRYANDTLKSKDCGAVVDRPFTVLHVNDEHGWTRRSGGTRKKSTKDATNDVHARDSNKKPRRNLSEVDDDDEIWCRGNCELIGRGDESMESWTQRGGMRLVFEGWCMTEESDDDENTTNR